MQLMLMFLYLFHIGLLNINAFHRISEFKKITTVTNNNVKPSSPSLKKNNINTSKTRLGVQVAKFNARIGEKCDVASECGSFDMMCLSNKCSCKYGYEFDGDFCSLRFEVPLGEACENSAQCKGLYSTCSSNICNCSHGYKIYENYCVSNKGDHDTKSGRLSNGVIIGIALPFTIVFILISVFIFYYYKKCCDLAKLALENSAIAVNIVSIGIRSGVSGAEQSSNDTTAPPTYEESMTSSKSTDNLIHNEVPPATSNPI